MLKRIKETLICTDSGGKRKSRIIYQSKLKSHHLLHSDESAYFYKNNSKGFFRLFRQPDQYSTNGVRYASPHQDLAVSQSESVRLNRTQRSREITPYSAIPGRSASIIPLMLSAFGLLLVLGMMIFPFDASCGMMHGIAYGVEEAYAKESNADNGISAQMEVPASGVALEIDTTLPEDNTIVEQVNGSGTKYISVNFTVGANDIDKYQVYVQADSTNLVGSTSKDVISSISTPTLGSNIGTKQWGYSVVKNHSVDTNTLTYNTIQTNVSTPADTVEAASGSKLTNITQPYTLAFAANLDGAKADHYKSNITLSVAANAEEVTTSTEFLGFYGINYMQDMTPAICEKARVGEVARLIDKRDQKLYWIGKLADNNCWMTQNLDLDLKQGEALTPELSDVQMDWTPGEGERTIATGSLNMDTWPNDVTLVRSYDPGDYVYTAGANLNGCGNQASLSDCVNWESTQHKIASGSPDFGPAIIDNTYNAHYTIGNYYNYNAATAGTGNGIVESNQGATGSVCPNGWQLPKSGGNDDLMPLNIDKSFAKLLEVYGWNWDVAPKENWQVNYYSDTTVSNTGYDMQANPMYFLVGGNTGEQTLSLVGYAGIYWSANALDETSSYRLGFDTRVNPASVSRRSHGLSIRCVARSV